MPQNWKTYKLVDLSERVCVGFVGTCHKHYTEKGNGVPMIRTTNLTEGGLDLSNVQYISSDFHLKQKKSQLRKGDILIARHGTNGKANLYDSEEDANCLNVVIVRPNQNKVDYKWLLYAINSDLFRTQVDAHSTGSVQKVINTTALAEFKINTPSITEQHAIASILSALDDKIELNLQMNKTLEEIAMALYKHWFVDFGPFKNGKFVESELGMIPKGWEVKRLGDILKIKHGFAFKGDFFVNDQQQALLLTPGNFSKNGGIQFNWTKQKYYSGEFPNEFILKKGDLILALTDLTQSCEILGAPALIPDNDFDYLHNQRLGLVQVMDKIFTNEIIYCIANTYNYREFIKNSKTGSTVSHTAPLRIYDYKIAYPKNADLHLIKESLKSIFEHINFNLSENKILSIQRDSLLPKLISGEIQIKNIEKKSV